MKTRLSHLAAALALAACPAAASDDLAASLVFHAPFDTGYDAEFSKGERACMMKKDGKLVPFAGGEDVVIDPNSGRVDGSLVFTKKSALRPHFPARDILGYNTTGWSATVSVWLSLTPDEDLEPGYCDPVQIIGDDTKKGFVFLEWSKDETPRFFRYAIRPRLDLWNPDNTPWDEIPANRRPMVQVANAFFARDRWTHVAFTLDGVNQPDGKAASGELFIDGVSQGRITGWDLTFDWDADTVALVLGASYVGRLDDLAVFNTVLTPEQIRKLKMLPGGVGDLR